MLTYLKWKDVLVNDPNTLESLLADILVNSIIVMVICWILALVIAFVIPSQPGAKPKDPGRRRLFFWVLLVLGAILAFLDVYLTRSALGNPNYLSLMYQQAGIAIGIGVGGYLALGFVLSKFVINRTKYGDVFGGK